MKIEIKNHNKIEQYKPLQLAYQETVFAEDKSNGEGIFIQEEDRVLRIDMNGELHWNRKSTDYNVRNIRNIKTIIVELEE